MPPLLPPHTLAVWLLDVDLASLDQLGPLLAPDEQDRASRFRFPEHRDRFIAARGALRFVLGSLTQTDPSRLAFDYGPHGKPALRHNPANLHFNLSHSGNLALISVTQAGALGVDIEKIDDRRAKPEIARRFFAPQEIAQLEALPGDAYTNAFFHCWTRKEAVLKAAGIGISGGLSSFAVPVDPTSTNFEVASPACSGATLKLALHLGYAAAVAVLAPPSWTVSDYATVLPIPLRRNPECST